MTILTNTELIKLKDCYREDPYSQEITGRYLDTITDLQLQLAASQQRERAAEAAAAEASRKPQKQDV